MLSPAGLSGWNPAREAGCTRRDKAAPRCVGEAAYVAAAFLATPPTVEYPVSGLPRRKSDSLPRRNRSYGRTEKHVLGYVSTTMPTHLEYKLEALSLDIDTLADYLSNQSSEGWELVTVVDAQAGGSMQRLIFRRELGNPTWDQPEA